MGSYTEPSSFCSSASDSPLESYAQPWVRTPVIRSAALSHIAGCNIHLKLETLQPSGSFKSRGIGNLLLSTLRSSSSKNQHFYCSSAGNAGLACAVAARTLGLPATIVVPLTTSVRMVEKLKVLGAEVRQAGRDWFGADQYLRTELLSKNPHGVYVPPFDHPDIWKGNGTLVDELEQQLPNYDVLVCSVGGGGLFAGIMGALDHHGRLSDFLTRKQVKVLAVETKGADSLALSMQKGKLAKLDGITSIATSLGATTVAAKAYEWAQHKNVETVVLSDAEAAMACVRFADDERIMVEAACGVSVATAYDGTLRAQYPQLSDEEFARLDVVIVVCGGSNVSLETLEEYRKTYGGDEEVVRKFKTGGKVGGRRS